jgi:hypothetical protein
MEDGSMWGALLVAWLLIVPIVGAVVSARWGGEHTAAGASIASGMGAARTVHDNASVPPERVDYAPTAGGRAVQQGAMRDREIRDRDGGGQPRH